MTRPSRLQTAGRGKPSAALPRIIPTDRAAAVARPADIADTYLELQHSAMGDEQQHLHRAEALASARPDAAKAAALAPFLDESTYLINGHRDVAADAKDRFLAVQNALGPWRRRTGSSIGYAIRFALLFAGEVVGPANAAIMYGDIPVLAVLQAISVGTAVVTAGLVGKEWKYLQLARERHREDPSVLGKELIPYIHLFDGTGLRARQPWVTVMIGTGATIGLLVGGAVLSLRSAVDGLESGVAFGAMAVAVSAASFINAYSHADQVSDLIEQSAKDYRDAQKKHRKLPLHFAHLFAALTAERAGSISDEHQHHGHAAAAHIEALMNEALNANPDVVGHGPSPSNPVRRPRVVKP